MTVLQILTGLVLLSLAVQFGAAASTPVGWSMVPPPANVPYGSPISFAILGPAGQQVTVAINAQPYNLSPPIFINTYTMPRSLVNGTAGVLNLSVPSNLFDLGRYQLTVQAATGIIIGQPILSLVSPVNFSALPGELATIWATLNATQAQYANVVQALSNSHFYTFLSVVVNFVLFGILFAALIFTRTRAAESHWGRRLWDWLRNAFFTTPWTTWGYERKNYPVPPSNAAKVFRGKFYSGCTTCELDHTEAGIRRHYMDPPTGIPETSGHGIPNPIRGIHYEASSALRKLRTRSRSAQAPDAHRLERLVLDPSHPLRVDMDGD